MDSILSVLATIAIIFGVVMLFNFMIFIHELGHFFAARWRGLYVDRFQIWFGRPIWKKTVNGVQWGAGVDSGRRFCIPAADGSYGGH